MILEIPESYIDQIRDRISWAMESLGMTREQAILYLWAFNNFSTCRAELKDCGRPMYRNLSKVLSRLVKYPSDVSQSDNITEKKLYEMLRDPKYWRDRDPDFVRQIENSFKKLYGENNEN